MIREEMNPLERILGNTQTHNSSCQQMAPAEKMINIKNSSVPGIQQKMTPVKRKTRGTSPAGSGILLSKGDSVNHTGSGVQRLHDFFEG